MYINFLQDMFNSSQSMIFIVLGGFYTITANALPTATLFLEIFHTANKPVFTISPPDSKRVDKKMGHYYKQEVI